MTKKKASAYEYAVSLLAVREHSRAELIRKMQRREYSFPEINSALEECRRLGYQDDRHFAETMTEMLRNSGRGERVIRQKLMLKGISREIIAEVLEERSENLTDLEAAEIAVHSRTGLWNREKDFRKRREKMLRFLTGRGFSFSLALESIRKLEQED